MAPDSRQKLTLDVPWNVVYGGGKGAHPWRAGAAVVCVAAHVHMTAAVYSAPLAARGGGAAVVCDQAPVPLMFVIVLARDAMC